LTICSIQSRSGVGRAALPLKRLRLSEPAAAKGVVIEKGQREMQTILITGASRGLGLEFASQYAAEGARVFGACRSPASAGALRDIQNSAASNFSIVEMDVTDLESVRRAAAQLDEASIDVLINNAGIGGAPGQTTGNIDYKSWAHVLDVNTLGPMRVLESFIEHLARSERKLAITITSAMGSLADNKTGGSIAYRSSKGAVNMAMRSAAIDLAPRGISCVLIHPGWVRTDMGGSNAPLPPQESVSAMRQLIGTFGPKNSGRFYSYNGREYPW
jgi:NAD(P)-dependent dehydrogenase (short-subunit alcohol dehydrogenase family)